MDFDKSILNEFIAESREHMDSIEEDLMAIEEQKDNPDPDLVNKVFRTAHSIKGGSSFLCLDKINSLAHAMEDILSKIRDGKLKLQTVHIDVLLDGSDTLRSMIDNAEESNSTDITAVLEKLNHFSGAEETDSSVEKTGSIEKGAESLEMDAECAEKGRGTKKFVMEDGTVLPHSSEVAENVPSNMNYIFFLEADITECEIIGEKKPLEMIIMISDLGHIMKGELRVNVSDLESYDISSDISVDAGSHLFFEVLFASEKTKDEIKGKITAGLKRLSAVTLTEIGDEKLSVQEEPVKLDSAESVIQKTEASVLNEPEIAGKSKNSEKSPPPPKVDSRKGDGPTQTIRLKVDLVDKLMTLAGELVLVRNRALLVSEKYDDQDLYSVIQRFDAVTTELQESVMHTRMQPVGAVFNKFPRVIRELSRKLDKEIELEIKGADSELDKNLVESLSDPMTHLIRNACDHGIETPDVRREKSKPPTGRVSLNAYHDSGQINIEIRDDGAGIDPNVIAAKAVEKSLKSEDEISGMTGKQKLSLIMMPGFSTAEEISDVSGRGVGMDVVKTTIENLGGSFDLESEKDKGSKITLRLPLTLAIVPSFIVKSGKKRFAVPQISIEEIVTVDHPESGFEYGDEWQMYRLRDTLIPLLRLVDVLENSEPFSIEKRKDLIVSSRERTNGDQSAVFMILKMGNSRYGMIVDRVIGTEEIVVKPLHPFLKNCYCYSGVTLMGDGSVALILNAEGIGRHGGIYTYSNIEQKEISAKNKEESEKRQVVLFSTGGDEQFALCLSQLLRIEKFNTDKIEVIENKEYISLDNRTYTILRVENFFKINPTEKKDEMFLLFLKHPEKAYGILVSELVDTVETTLDLDTQVYCNDFVDGTRPVDGKLTIFLKAESLANGAGNSYEQ